MTEETKTRIMMAIGGAFTLAAIITLIVGLLTHDEAGFIGGVPQWDPEGLPLRVHPAAYRGELTEEQLSDVGNAVHAVNTRLGFEMLALYTSSDAGGADIETTLGAPTGVGAAAGGHSSIHRAGDMAVTCAVVTRNTGTRELLWLTLYHELGHCLGLAHDDFEMSIMRPVQRPTAAGQIPPWISDWDRDLLRKRYMH